MTDALSTEFSAWMQDMGYLDEDGVLVINMREARALFLQQGIRNCKVAIEENLTQICLGLWEFYKNQLWTELGYDSFEQLLYSPEIDLSRSVGYSYKELGRCLEEGIIDADWLMRAGTSKARALLPKLCSDNEDIEEWKLAAEELSTADLQIAVTGKEVFFYHGKGMLSDLIDELRDRPEFWETDVTLHAKTCT